MPTVHDNNFSQTGLYIRQALRHEAVHVAQSCNNGEALEPSNHKKKLHLYKLDALNKSTLISGNIEKEHEAYWMQTKPKLVINALKKYCFGK